MRGIALGLTLIAFWLALSGHYTPFLLAVGGACVAFSVWLAFAMKIVDEEGQPVYLYGRAVFYWAWLWAEIFKSAVEVSKIIWTPRLPISATMTRVKARQKTAVGLATYANSITLTPGTITTGVKDTTLTVHALSRAGADDIEDGRMNRRVRDFEGAD